MEESWYVLNILQKPVSHLIIAYDVFFIVAILLIFILLLNLKIITMIDRYGCWSDKGPLTLCYLVNTFETQHDPIVRLEIPLESWCPIGLTINPSLLLLDVAKVHLSSFVSLLSFLTWEFYEPDSSYKLNNRHLRLYLARHQVKCFDFLEINCHCLYIELFAILCLCVYSETFLAS